MEQTGIRVGRPVIVGSTPKRNGVVAVASCAARLFGSIQRRTMAIPVLVARGRCERGTGDTGRVEIAIPDGQNGLRIVEPARLEQT